MRLALLASEARAGELLISDSALALANVSLEGAERRELVLRGREAPLAVHSAQLGLLTELALG
jgi:hypothetical protein